MKVRVLLYSLIKFVDKLLKYKQLNNKETDEDKLQFEEFVTNHVP